MTGGPIRSIGENRWLLHAIVLLTVWGATSAFGLTAVLITVFGLLGVGTVLVLYGTIARNGWGINLAPVSCPRCGTLQPRRRRPRNTRQYLWGGGTCAQCGAELDKWGREIVEPR
jgi:hypothetical protein